MISFQICLFRYAFSARTLPRQCCLPRTSSLEAHDAQEPCPRDVNFDYLARCHLIPPLYPYQFVSNLKDHVNILLLHKVFLVVASIDNPCLTHPLLWLFPNADFATPALSLHLPGGSWHSKQELSLLSIDSLIYLFFFFDVFMYSYLSLSGL